MPHGTTHLADRDARDARAAVQQPLQQPRDAARGVGGVGVDAVRRAESPEDRLEGWREAARFLSTGWAHLFTGLPRVRRRRTRPTIGQAGTSKAASACHHRSLHDRYDRYMTVIARATTGRLSRVRRLAPTIHWTAGRCMTVMTVTRRSLRAPSTGQTACQKQQPAHVRLTSLLGAALNAWTDASRWRARAATDRSGGPTARPRATARDHAPPPGDASRVRRGSARARGSRPATTTTRGRVKGGGRARGATRAPRTAPRARRFDHPRERTGWLVVARRDARTPLEATRCDGVLCSAHRSQAGRPARALPFCVRPEHTRQCRPVDRPRHPRATPGTDGDRALALDAANDDLRAASCLGHERNAALQPLSLPPHAAPRARDAGAATRARRTRRRRPSRRRSYPPDRYMTVT